MSLSKYQGGWLERETHCVQGWWCISKPCHEGRTSTVFPWGWSLSCWNCRQAASQWMMSTVFSIWFGRRTTTAPKVCALKSITDELDINVLKPRQVRGTQLLPQVSQAPKVFVSHPSNPASVSGRYAVGLLHMGDLSINSKVADIQGRARYIAEKMKYLHFAAFCHFLADLFTILSWPSLQMQQNYIILPTVVSLFKETMPRIECLASRPVPDGHLTKFMQKVEGTQNFQGVPLRGSLEGKHWWKHIRKPAVRNLNSCESLHDRP